LNPLGILHIEAFVTFCEAYMGIEPHFNMWNYFFCTRFLQGSGAKAVVLGGVDLYIRSRHGVDPYFHLPMSKPSNRWQKVWFFLRNDADASLPVFTGSRPIPQPNWRYKVARMDLRRLQPLCEVIQQLLREGLTCADLFQPPSSIAPSAKYDHVDVFRTK
jgi:hypothetical protein